MSDDSTPAPAKDDPAAPAPEPRRRHRPAWEDELGPERPSPSDAPTSSEAPTAEATEGAPLRDRYNELLADPPHQPTVGALTGYRDGSRTRRRIFVALVVGVGLAIYGGYRYTQWLEEQAKQPPTPAYQLADGAEGESRPDALVWTDGTARLGLSNQEPGVKAIVLPDRVLTLAPGCDHAQVKVDVQGGKTVKLKVLVGEIEETLLRPETAPAPRDE